MKHERFFLNYWWQWLDQTSIDEQGFDTGDVLCEPTCEKWVDASRIVHITEQVLFPAQHFLWTPVDLEKGGTGKLVPLYDYEGTNGIRLNLEYLTTWRKWRTRQVSSADLVPEDLKQIFADPHGAIVSEHDVEVMGEDEAKSFLETQASLFGSCMGWSPGA